MTRALLAFDSSSSANRALGLAGSLAWTAGSELRLVGVVPFVSDFALAGAPWVLPAATPIARASLDPIEEARKNLQAAAARLERPGLSVTQVVLVGHPSEEILGEAAKFEAELIVVGSRGHGALANALLGSVAAALVDHAPCPVLVARTSVVRSILLASDGSAAAGNACALASSPLFGGAKLTAAVVADTRWPWWSGMTEAAGAMDFTAQEAAAEGLRVKAQAVARQVRDTLTASDCLCDTVLLEGDPAAALLAEAVRSGTDLVALGSRGHTGVQRLVLGSVARNVLLHAPCSVLIAHAPHESN